MANLTSSRQFWEEKACENPYWYVSSYGSYEKRDQNEFWNSGLTIWEDIKKKTGFRPSSRDVVVEIGCGVGRLTNAITKDVGHCHAFDIAQNMIEIAQTKVLDRVSYHLTDGVSLKPIQDGAADLTLAYCVLQHLPTERDLQVYLREMVRVTKPGGMIAFTTSPKNWKAYLLPLARLKGALRAITANNAGPSGTYKKEWVGIRPSRSTISRRSPIKLQNASLGAERVLYWGAR